MQKSIKLYFIPLFTLIYSFFLILPAKAVCPICTIAVGTGVGLSRYLGVDDTITGLWIGGITISFILWTLDWFKKKNIKFKGIEIVTYLGYIILIVGPLIYSKTIGHPFNKIWGVDKLLFGIILGAILFYGTANLYEYLKKKNNNHAHFPYEKIVINLIPLILFSGIFYFITK